MRGDRVAVFGSAGTTARPETGKREMLGQTFRTPSPEERSPRHPAKAALALRSFSARRGANRPAPPRRHFLPDYDCARRRRDGRRVLRTWLLPDGPASRRRRVRQSPSGLCGSDANPGGCNATSGGAINCAAGRGGSAVTCAQNRRSTRSGGDLHRERTTRRRRHGILWRRRSGDRISGRGPGPNRSARHHGRAAGYHALVSAAGGRSSVEPAPLRS